MAGHSKWKNIRFRKTKQDAKKSKILTKFSRNITLAAMNDTNIETNLNLKTTILLAKANGVSKDVIDKAIIKAKNKDQIKGSEMIYEGFGPDGSAFIVIAFTDNVDRTAPAVRHIFNKYGGNMSSSRYLFDKCGEIIVEDKIENIIDKIDIIDFIEEEGKCILYTENLNDISKLNNIIEANIIYKPHNIIEIDNKNIENIYDKLEELDDVTDIFTNF